MVLSHGLKLFIVDTVFVQRFDKPLFISLLSYAGLSLITPFCGLRVETLSHELRWRCFIISILGVCALVFFSVGLVYLPLSTIMLIRVRGHVVQLGKGSAQNFALPDRWEHNFHCSGFLHSSDEPA